MTRASSVCRVDETNSVASAMPYDGLIAVFGRPYGANASLNLRIEDVVTGSLPLIRPITLLRSRVSPGLGRPRAAACSNAKFGAAANVPAPSETAASSLIHRPGRCTKARGLMMVMYLPPIAGRMTVSRPMSWNSGSHVTPREPSLSSMESAIWMQLVSTPRWVISTPAGTRVDPEVYCR
ncbi:hypothetical protein AIIKEEIJ_02504 [Rhodococcus sp. YH1]|nr:hypothetical protein [Rhodococcus sp. YH1]